MVEVVSCGTGETDSLKTQGQTAINLETLASLLKDVVASRAGRADKAWSLDLVATLLASNIDSAGGGWALEAALEESVIGVSREARSACVLLGALAVSSTRDATLTIEEGSSWARLSES